MKRLFSEIADSIASRIIKRRKLYTTETPVNYLDFAPTVNENWTEWVSASRTRNYALDDSLSDWFEIHYKKKIKRSKSHGNNSYPKPQIKSSYSFEDTLKLKGHEFEDNVIDFIENKFGDKLVKLTPNSRSAYDLKDTIREMIKGTPFIYNSVLQDKKTKTYGIPDLIVRSDWLNRLVKYRVYNIECMYTPAPKLRRNQNDNLPSYHYVIVDIKNTQLNLDKNCNIQDSNSVPAYKIQLYIYNEILSKIQGYNPNKAFILGNGTKTHKYDKFRKLGIIDYRGKDKNIPSKALNAVKWRKDVQSPQASSWDINGNYPLCRIELHPNMTVKNSPYYKLKHKIAMKNNEVSLLFKVGNKTRQELYLNGIYSWDDPKLLNGEINISGLGVHTKTYKIIQTIINANINSFTPPSSSNLIKTTNDVEFYIDFESIGSMITGRKYDFITMIGVGCYNRKLNNWEYKNFIADTMTIEEENWITVKTSDYILKKSQEYNVKNPTCFHWGNFEPRVWSQLSRRHKGIPTNKWEWVDLCSVFISTPIVINGSLDFKLKNIAGAFSKHGLIKTTWDENSVSNGQQAAIEMFNVYKDRQISITSQNTFIKDDKLMKEIIKYNEIDVKVLFEMILYLRDNCM